MKINKFLFAIIVFSFLITNVLGQKMVTLDKRLNEGAGDYGMKLAPLFENQPGNAAKQKAMQPFVIAFYGWKSMKLAELGVGKIEAAHLDINRVMLGLYDDEIDSLLKTIVARAQTPTDWVDVSDAERKTIHKFVVMKYGGSYLGLNGVISGNYKQPDKIEAWKYSFGAAMGELAGNLINWYKLPNNPSYHQKISQNLLGLQKDITAAPGGTAPELLENVRRLALLGNKTQFNEAERDSIAAMVKITLLSTLSFAGQPTASNPVTPAAPQKTANDYLQQGLAFAAKGDYANAVANYNESIKLNSINGMAYYHRAKALEELGRIDEAIKDYHLMIANKTDLKKAFYNRGTLYLDKKNYVGAIDDFDKSLALDPKSSNTYYNRGIAYFSLGNFDKALADFSQAIILSPRETDSYIMRADSYCQKGQTALALKDQEQALALGAKITKGCGK